MTYTSRTRRIILKLSGSAAAASIAGCLGNSGGNNSDGNDFAPLSASSFPLKNLESTFNLWNWYDGLNKYTAKNMPEDYQNLQSVSTNGFSSSSEWFSKLKAGNSKIDNLCSTPTYSARAIEQDLVYPLPVDKLPNYGEVLKMARQQMKNKFSDKDGNVYAAPLAIGLQTALGYNSNVFDKGPNSWDVLWDPEYKNKLTMQDHPLVAGFIAARYTGQEYADPKDWQDIEEALKQQKPLMKTYYEDYATGQRLFVNKTVVAGGNTMGRFFSAHFDKDAPYIEYSIPDEGALYFIDNFHIPKQAPHPKASMEFIHWYLKPKNAIQLFLKMGYLPPLANITDVMKKHNVPKQKREFVRWSQEQRDRLIFWEPLPSKVQQKYTDIWTKVKSS